MAARDDVRRLAADLGRFLDQLPVELGAEARTARRERLEAYVSAMTAAQRARLAGALHLLSPRFDEQTRTRPLSA